jgi:hypothetical protein
MDPAAADAQAIFAAVAAGGDVGNFVEVAAGVRHSALLVVIDPAAVCLTGRSATS